MLPIAFGEALGWVPEASVALTLGVCFSVNFFVTRSFVFRSRGHAGSQLAGFFVLSAIFRALEYGGFLVFYWVGQWHESVCLVAALSISFVFKFFAQRSLVFRRPP